MAKSAWWNPFTWGAEEPEIRTHTVEDPMKIGVATPYSEYLKTQIGKGVPRYEGPLTADLDPEAKNRYSEFISLDAGQWFDKAVGDPATKKFKRDLLPTITEGYAGSLRGSGRYRAEEAGISEFSEYLAGERYKAARDIPKEQFAMASQYKAMKDRDYQIEYADWLKSLPQYNPALQQAAGFLNKQISTGTTILSALDPGSKGWLMDLLGVVVDFFGVEGKGGSSAGDSPGTAE